MCIQCDASPFAIFTGDQIEEATRLDQTIFGFREIRFNRWILFEETLQFAFGYQEI